VSGYVISLFALGNVVALLLGHENPGDEEVAP